jgi:hypothetical protein
LASSDKLLDSINATPLIAGNKFINDVSYFIGTKERNSIALFPRSEYTLSFNALVNKNSGSITLDQPDYSVEVYLVPVSGSTSRVLNQNPLGQLIGVLTPSSTFQSQNFDRVEFNFTPQISNPGLYGLRFVFYGGFWNISNVSVKPAQEPFFSPDEINILVPVIDYDNSLVQFKVNFLDINNNSSAIYSVSTPTYFSGSQVYVKRSGDTMSGALTINTPNAKALNLNGLTSLQSVIEKTTISNISATGTVNFDVATQAILFYSANSTGNWTLNLRANAATSLNSIMEIGQTITIAFFVSNGSTPYYPTAHSIDGTSITPSWQGGVVPVAGNANCIDVYNYSIVKTADSTFIMLASQTRFG